MSNKCTAVGNELAVDADGDGAYGDNEGYIYPGAPNVVKCEEYMPPQNKQVCKSPAGCPPDSADDVKYYVSDSYVSFLQAQCERSQSVMKLFVAAGVLTIFSGIFWFYWTHTEFSDNVPVIENCGSVSQALAIVALVCVIFSAISYYQGRAPPSNIMGSFVNCAAMSTQEYYLNGLEPQDKCYVTNSSCDPFDYQTGKYFKSGSNAVGTCTYASDELVGVACGDATKGATDIQTTPTTDCEAVDCSFGPLSIVDGPNYKSSCCQARRKCCGDTASCALSSVCQWNETYIKDGNTQSNVCFNKYADESFACNDVQKKAFELQLRRDGVCFSNTFNSKNLEIEGGATPGDSDKCRANRKNQLIEAALVYAAATGDANLQTLTRDILTSNLPECMVQQYHTDCFTDCMDKSQANCPATAPFPGAPGNCTVVGNDCVPNKSLYTDDKVKKARPMEFCESLYDGTSQETIDASKTACLGQDTCYWASVFGKDRCLSKACAGAPGNPYHGAYGYQPLLSPPCYAGDSLNNNYVPATFKVCKFPSKGCTPSGQTALCRTTTDAKTNGYYYSPTNAGVFNPGPAFSIAECKVAPVGNCTQFDTLSGLPCVLVKGSNGSPTCTSVYAACPDGSDMKTQYNRDKDIQKGIKAASDANSFCTTDQSGTFRVPLAYDLYICDIFFGIGIGLSVIFSIILIISQPLFKYNE